MKQMKCRLFILVIRKDMLSHLQIFLYNSCTPLHSSLVFNLMYLWPECVLDHLSNSLLWVSFALILAANNYNLLFYCQFRGLMCIHRMKIVHRDLKSANCLVNKHWTVKICDFGLSRMMIDVPMRDTSSAGTPEWMAPELIRNEPFTEKCDIFSFGVIMWELCTLNRPWEGVPPERVRWHVLLSFQISTVLLTSIWTLIFF